MGQTTSATNGPNFNWLSQQTNHLFFKGTRLTPYNSIKIWDFIRYKKNYMLGNNSKTNHFTDFRSVNFKMQVKPCATSVPNFNSLSLQTNYLWSKEENLLIQIVSRFGIKSLSEVKYAWQQLLDQLMDFKSLNVEQQGKTSATNGPNFNCLSQQTNHLLLKELD